MMARAGWDVRLYGGEANEADVTEHVQIVSRAEQAAWYPNYVPERDVWNDFDPAGEGWQTFNRRAAAAIRERAEPHDVVCLTMGSSQRQVAELVEDLGLLVVETGVGYSGVWAPHRVYESHAWRHFLAAREPVDDARFFDAVIPRAYDAASFPRGTGSGGYLLFVGRLMTRKGPAIAAETARRLGMKLVVAGQGARSWSRQKIVCSDGLVLDGDVEYAGVVGPAQRAELMGGAAAILTPTLYFEPFGGVSVEGQLTGTPAVVSDWGGLPENVVAGETGFACSTLADFVDATRAAASLDRERIREHAIATWSFDAIAPRFNRYFRRLEKLYGDGWYAAAA
jgi:glycosyltransferase involved in cell wall biosynthesis